MELESPRSLVVYAEFLKQKHLLNVFSVDGPMGTGLVNSIFTIYCRLLRLDVVILFYK